MPQMSPEAKEKLARFNEAQTDWYGVCQKCHLKLMGSLKELKAHKCEVKDE